MIKIGNFKYNGFCGQSLEGVAPYTAEFQEWTSDPGVFRAKCSDGKERLIPTFAILKGMEKIPPKPDYQQMKEDGSFQYFGSPSCS